MAIVDSAYRFSLIDVGGEGRQRDSAVFKTSLIDQALENESLDLPRMGTAWAQPHRAVRRDRLRSFSAEKRLPASIPREQRS